MIDLIKTFILGIWIEKRYRYIFLFLTIAILYRILKWIMVLTTFTMSPVSFISINNDGSLKFVFLKKYIQNIYPNNYQLPVKNGRKNKNYEVKNIYNTKECEKEFFKIYQDAISRLINSSVDKKFIIHFDKKFPTKIGDISYFNNLNNEVFIYETLYNQGFIFDKKKDINYCLEIKNFKN